MTSVAGMERARDWVLGGEIRQATRVEGGDIALDFIPNELERHHNILITKALT